MFSLIVRPVEHADIARYAALHIEALGSLVIGRPPPYNGYLEDQMASIKNDIDNKPYVHHLKVVDTDDDNKILAYAKWEVYEHDRPDLKALKQPIDEESKQVDEYGRLREAAHDYFCTRNGKIGQSPHILLALLVTSRQHKQKGAGSLLVQWGIEKSETIGLPYYLQASKQGQRLYQHYGFKDIDTVEFNLADYGLGIERMTEMNRYHSKAENMTHFHGDFDVSADRATKATEECGMHTGRLTSADARLGAVY